MLFLRMEAPSSKVVESMLPPESLLELEGESLPQTHAGTFKFSLPNGRLKIFNGPLGSNCAEILAGRRAPLDSDLDRAQSSMSEILTACRAPHMKAARDSPLRAGIIG